jgi:hypothetical protein
MSKLLLLILLMLRPGPGLPAGDYGQAVVTQKQARQALNHALLQENAPYIWGGQSPAGFDCSGLQEWSYRQVISNIVFASSPGVALDVTEDSLYKYNAFLLSSAEVVPGDLVFITDNPHTITHGGMFSKWIIPGEKFEFINASSYFGKVVIDSWSVRGEVRGQWFAGFGRLKYLKAKTKWRPAVEFTKPTITKPSLPVFIPFS